MKWLLLVIMSVFLCSPVNAATYVASPEPEIEVLEDGIMPTSSYPSYQTASSSGQAWLKGVLTNYPVTDGYVYCRTGNYQYVLWVGGEYTLNSSSVTAVGGEKYEYNYHYMSNGTSYVTVNHVYDVSDTLTFTNQTFYSVYGSLKGLSAFRDGGNIDAQTLYCLAVVGLAVLLLPYYALISRRRGRGE